MKNILILYPNEFNCQSKFDRKVSNIVQNLEHYTLCYINDYNGLIQNYSSIYQVENYKINNLDNSITHAIIFDDGKEFDKEVNLIDSLKIIRRVIKIQITRVINIKDNHQYNQNSEKYEYIGRGSYWGNPYAIFDNDGDNREDVIRKFKYDFDTDLFLNKKKSEVYRLAGKTLGCFCKPQSCHGDVLADYLNSYDDGK